jgi:hypothetical protein
MLQNLYSYFRCQLRLMGQYRPCSASSCQLSDLLSVALESQSNRVQLVLSESF